MSFDCDNCGQPVEPYLDNGFLIYEDEATCECGAIFKVRVDNRYRDPDLLEISHTFWNPEEFEE
jgi:hypothetical protein